MHAYDLERASEIGMDWSLRERYACAEDKEHCEEYGCMRNADLTEVSLKAKKKGLPQLSALGAGNYRAEIKVMMQFYSIKMQLHGY